jgi:hypothetical protein
MRAKASSFFIFTITSRSRDEDIKGGGPDNDGTEPITTTFFRTMEDTANLFFAHTRGPVAQSTTVTGTDRELGLAG